MRIEPYHWALWAHDASEPAHVNLGYRGMTEFYTEPRRSDDKIPTLDPPSDEDWILAKRIGIGVRALQAVEPEAAGYLVQWFGAYPGAPKERKARVLKMGINARTALSVVNEWKCWVEGWVVAYQEFHKVA